MTNIKKTKTWVEVKKMLKTKYSKITEADLLYEEGFKEEMLNKLADKVGKTRVELDKLIAFYSKLL